MTQEALQVKIVSAEQSIYEGKALMLQASGEQGELEIHPGHAQLLTALSPGQVYITKQDGSEDVIYISGGMLEVQPHEAIVLADTATRAADLDESRAIAAKEAAERAIAERKTEADYSKALGELAQAIAQIQAIRKLQKLKGR